MPPGTGPAAGYRAGRGVRVKRIVGIGLAGLPALAPAPAAAAQLLELPRAGQGEFELYGLAVVGLLLALVGIALALRRGTSRKA